MNVEQFNEESINQQSIRILKQYQIPFDPSRQLASLVLIREALERGLLETGELQEPLLLIAKLAANPELAMSLMTESDTGDEYLEMELSETLEAAAAEILEEIVASDKIENPRTVAIEATSSQVSEFSDSVFAQYIPQRLTIADAKQHPGKLVQAAAMSAVEPPAPTYSPTLPENVIREGLLSLAQLEAVVYAGQAHSGLLPNGNRSGFFHWRWTGVGKGTGDIRHYPRQHDAGPQQSRLDIF